MKLITFEQVEAKVQKRVEEKARKYGQDVDSNGTTKFKIDPSLVSQLYGDWIMPLTKVVQVQYLLRRLDLYIEE
jgi:chorismate mutase